MYAFIGMPLVSRISLNNPEVCRFDDMNISGGERTITATSAEGRLDQLCGDRSLL